MTRVDFYINVESRERTACTIAAKAIERGVRLFVLTADEAQSERVDRLMWTFAQLSFLPHVRAAHPLAARTPVIVDHAAEPLPHDQVLLNLTDATPAVFSRFERLVEIVSLDPDDRQRARARWKFYSERGYALASHDLARPAGTAGRAGGSSDRTAARG
jgi:DNA polymerase-3 subunit chi